VPDQAVFSGLTNAPEQIEDIARLPGAHWTGEALGTVARLRTGPAEVVVFRLERLRKKAATQPNRTKARRGGVSNSRSFARR
jgi:hypothetical protein